MHFQSADILGISSTEFNRYKSIEKENTKLKQIVEVCKEALNGCNSDYGCGVIINNHKEALKKIAELEKKESE